MRSQKGFIGLGVLLAIVLGLIVVGGGAYYVTHQNTSSQFLTITSPQSGAMVSAASPTQVKWRFDDSSIVQTFPSTNTYVVLHIIASNGQDIGSIGDGYPISGTSASWNIASNLTQNFYTLTSGAQYKIRATLQYQPTHYTCDTSMPKGPKECVPLYSDADKALIAKAKQYQSESGWFTVNLDGYAHPTATIDAGSALSGTASGVTSVSLQMWVADNPNVLSVKVPVSNGKWSYTPPASMQSGVYEVNVWTPDGATSLVSGTFKLTQ